MIDNVISQKDGHSDATNCQEIESWGYYVFDLVTAGAI